MNKKQVDCAADLKRAPLPGRRYELAIDESIANNLLRHLIIWVQLPGIERSQLDVRLAGNVLTIKEAEAKVLALAELERAEIIGNSQKLRHCLDQVARAAATDEAVLICGETGTGKEIFARAVHRNSRRDGENFVVVDCRSIPESIAEKLLLGQPRNTRHGHQGLLPQANRGTLFLDEVGDLPAATQRLFKKLLQEKSYRPVGAITEIRVNFRLIAATNRNLQKMVAQGKFNADLLSLLQPLLVEIPALRDRQGDIGLLTDFFLRQLCQARKLEAKDLSPEFRELLQKYPWPGNIRELVNSLDQALLAAKNQKTLFPKDLPAHIRVHVKKSAFNLKKTIPVDEPGDEVFNGRLATDSPW